MKKKLEAELISIAHRVLKLKNKSELIQLQQEALKLYEKLSVLRFVEENFGDVQPTIGLDAVKVTLEASFENEEISKIIGQEKQVDIVDVVNSVQEFENKNEADTFESPAENEEKFLDLNNFEQVEVADVAVHIEEEIIFKPAFELTFEAKVDGETSDKTEQIDNIKPSATQISFEDLLGSSYVEPVFLTPEEFKKEHDAAQKNKTILEEIETNQNQESVAGEDKSQKTIPSSELHSKAIAIGLNDKIAFLKHLFGNSNEDYNRVLSQLITYSTFEEAQNFIDEMVKPDYTNWEGKEEYALRFMDIIEKKFSK